MGMASEGAGASLEGAVVVGARVLLAVLPDAESAERTPQPLLAAPGLPATPAPAARVQCELQNTQSPGSQMWVPCSRDAGATHHMHGGGSWY